MENVSLYFIGGLMLGFIFGCSITMYGVIQIVEYLKRNNKE